MAPPERPQAQPKPGVSNHRLEPSDVRPQPLVVEALDVRFGGVKAVSSVDLEVQPGTVVGLIGPNGAGKTSLIDAVSGLVQANAASLRLGSTSLAGLPPHARANLGLSRTFQAVELFEDLTVGENLSVAAAPPRTRDWLTAFVRPRPGALSAEARAVVEMLGLWGELDLLPEQLPLAKRRLAAVARSVVRWPSILMLDEPASGLTRQEAEMLGATLRRVASECGIGILLVEHNVEMVMAFADRIVAMDFGAKIADGSPAEVRNDPEVLRAYLGANNSPEPAEVAP